VAELGRGINELDLDFFQSRSASLWQQRLSECDWPLLASWNATLHHNHACQIRSSMQFFLNQTSTPMQHSMHSGGMHLKWTAEMFRGSCSSYEKQSFHASAVSNICYKAEMSSRVRSGGLISSISTMFENENTLVRVDNVVHVTQNRVFMLQEFPASATKQK
jgi:hypothetical protein